MDQKSVGIGPFTVGSSTFTIIAGPCSIESEEQFIPTARSVLNHGASIIRGGIYKMRTQPDSFQGLRDEAIPLVQKMKQETGAPFISEISDPRQIEKLLLVVDCFQVGSRNMYNYELLKELGKQDRPVLLKRSFSALVEEWVKAAEYIVVNGNENVILCERGIRCFEGPMRNTLDLSAVAYVKKHFPYPVIVDPSHGTGRQEIIAPMSKAAVACGADGLIVEVHPHPQEALSDGFQSLTPEAFKDLTTQLQPFIDLASKKNHGSITTGGQVIPNGSITTDGSIIPNG